MARHDAHDAYTKAMGNLAELATTLSEVANRQAKMVADVSQLQDNARGLDDRIAGQGHHWEAAREAIRRLDGVLVQHAEVIQRLASDMGRGLALLDDLGRRVAALENKEVTVADAGGRGAPSDSAAPSSSALDLTHAYEDRSYAPGSAAHSPATMTSPNTPAP